MRESSNNNKNKLTAKQKKNQNEFMYTEKRKNQTPRISKWSNSKKGVKKIKKKCTKIKKKVSKTVEECQNTFHTGLGENE